jgi:hypothetical protein
MNHTESAYVNIGVKFERAQTPDRARAVAEQIRAMLNSEDPRDMADCRRLIEQGRAEVRH